MANPMQVRASVNRWLDGLFVLDASLKPDDRKAWQGIQGQQSNEWHVSWDAERDGRADQNCSRLFQITRARADGDEIALERELSALMATMGIDRPGRSAAVTVYGYPAAVNAPIGTALVRRFRSEGWKYLPDPGDRADHLRAVLTLQVEYTAG